MHIFGILIHLMLYPYSPPEDLLELIRDPFQRGEECNYMSGGGRFGTDQFSNTCVLDSFLAGLHICERKYTQIRDLFMSDRTISAVMTFLDCRMYNKAKALWLINLSLLSEGCTYPTHDGCVDIRGYVKDHLPMVNDMVCGRYHCDQDRGSPSTDDVCRKTLR